MPYGRISPDSETSPNRKLIAYWPLPGWHCHRLRRQIRRNLRIKQLRPPPRRLRRNRQPVRIKHNQRRLILQQVLDPRQLIHQRRRPLRLRLQLSLRQRPRAWRLCRRLLQPQPQRLLLQRSLRLTRPATLPPTARKKRPLRLRPTVNCPGKVARSFSLPRVRTNDWLIAFRRNTLSKPARVRPKEQLSSKRWLMRTARLRACDWSREALPWQPPRSKL